MLDVLLCSHPAGRPQLPVDVKATGGEGRPRSSTAYSSCCCLLILLRPAHPGCARTASDGWVCPLCGPCCLLALSPQVLTLVSQSAALELHPQSSRRQLFAAAATGSSGGGTYGHAFFPESSDNHDHNDNSEHKQQQQPSPPTTSLGPDTSATTFRSRWQSSSRARGLGGSSSHSSSSRTMADGMGGWGFSPDAMPAGWLIGWLAD